MTPGGGKKTSHCRTNFPSCLAVGSGCSQQRARELQSKQVIALSRRIAQRSCPEVARDAGQQRQSSYRGAGDLKTNEPCKGEDPANSQQHAAGADIQSSGKLQKLIAFTIMTAHKNGDGQGKSRPHSPLCVPSDCSHAQLPQRTTSSSGNRSIWGATFGVGTRKTGTKDIGTPQPSTRNPCQQGSNRELIRFFFA
jgi:hypothetical protein